MLPGDWAKGAVPFSCTWMDVEASNTSPRLWVVWFKASPTMPMGSPDVRVAGTAPSQVFRKVWVLVEAMPSQTVGAGAGRGDS